MRLSCRKTRILELLAIGNFIRLNIVVLTECEADRETDAFATAEQLTVKRFRQWTQPQRRSGCFLGFDSWGGVSS